MKTLRCWQRYALALVLVVIATLARLGLDPVLGGHAPYPTYFLAVVITCWSCGLGPSILCVVISLLAADLSFLVPRGKHKQ